MSVLTPILPENSAETTWSGLHGAALGLAINEAAQHYQGTLVVVLDNQRQLDILQAEIDFFRPVDSQVRLQQFPAWECLPYDNFSPSSEVIANRLKQLSELSDNPHPTQRIILVHASNLMQQLPPRDYVRSHSFQLERGQTLDLQEFRAKLTDTHYIAVDQVFSAGEFAIRGGVIDLFPMGSDTPYRIDFFDNEIDSLRSFDVDSQRSMDTVEKIELLPAREFPLSEAAIKLFRMNFRQQFEGDPKKQTIYNRVSDGKVTAGIEFYLPLFFEQTTSLFDYLPDNSCFIYPSSVDDHYKTHWAEIQDRYQNAIYVNDSQPLTPSMLYLDADSITKTIKQYSRVVVDNAVAGRWRAASQIPTNYPVDSKQSAPYEKLIGHLKHIDHPVLLLSDSAVRQEALQPILIRHDIQAHAIDSFEKMTKQSAAVFTAIGRLQRGLMLSTPKLEIICESQLYGEKVFQNRQRSQAARDPDLIIKSLAELSIGDLVVHIEHGVGRYMGLQTLDILDDNNEYLIIVYQGDDKLYVPITSLNLVSRFLGAANATALNKLGSSQWQKAKKKAQQKAYDAATELLETEAYRLTRSGHAFSFNEDEFKQFSDDFAFEETPDQYQAIEEISKDLVISKPMDRLVCGDVGFGKTEVAMRAAFIVANSGKQVAVLTPTTLLAQQHHQTFVERFNNWPISIDLLSRFNTAKKTKEVIDKAKNGILDIVIGTHKLLQGSVSFKDLGLLIIDEEHRFGVRQKEYLKRLRSQVDVLTLTATPIPRTLNFAMSGLRDISIIGTPPVNRLAIKTFIRKSTTPLIKEACTREIRRGGQVFVLHNDVKSIERITDEISELLPEAEVRFCHGQMRELQMEKIMQDFYNQRFNILVCTTIVESGIDIPSANTIIINRADKFGLAQLHQLRGRVGRSNQQAFAYLLLPEGGEVTNDAKKRLDAISTMEDLGAGFVLASHDLEIRGAGELLGETQSGAIDEIGFSLYSEYLNQAVQAIKQGKLPSTDTENEKLSTVDLHLAAIFPTDYLPNTHTRLVLYKRIASATDEEQLQKLQVEVADRFGLPPDPVKNLFMVTALRLSAEKFDIKKIDFSANGGVFEFFSDPNVSLDLLLTLIQKAPQTYRLEQPMSLRVNGDYQDEQQRITMVKTVLQLLSGEIDINSINTHQ